MVSQPPYTSCARATACTDEFSTHHATSSARASCAKHRRLELRSLAAAAVAAAAAHLHGVPEDMRATVPERRFAEIGGPVQDLDRAVGFQRPLHVPLTLCDDAHRLAVHIVDLCQQATVYYLFVHPSCLRGLEDICFPCCDCRLLVTVGGLEDHLDVLLLAGRELLRPEGLELLEQLDPTVDEFGARSTLGLRGGFGHFLPDCLPDCT